MITTNFQGKTLSMLGFGAMRLPTDEQGQIDEAQLEQMIKTAFEGGVNYFDTAWPYHGGLSEVALGKALAAYPRESWYLATKYPGHQISSSYDPAAVFEKQLKKCGVQYFDFYLLHNVNESCIDTYLDPKWGILDYFREQKRLERIKHLGFSCHGGLDCLRAFLDAAGEEMEFCQIQLNFLDWTLQNAKAKVDLLNERHMPIWVMEPVRGGKLCDLGKANNAALRACRPQESIPAWGFRFLQDVPGVTMILSGMSTMAQMEDNLKTFSARKPLTDEETRMLLDIAESMKDSVPCTACRYCTANCPMGLDIPALLSVYNELRVAPSVTAAMRLEALAPNKQPSACVGCGACAAICPQKIEIPALMRDLALRLETIPKWRDICKAREEAEKKAAK